MAIGIGMTRYNNKIKTIDELTATLGPHNGRNITVVMCHGVFDIVHPGHLRHLMFAKEHADILVASLTADEHIKKANIRPYVPEQLRALNLAAFEFVDYVVIDRNPTAIQNIELLQPNYFAKGYEYAGNANEKTREELAAVEAYGGEILFTPGDVVYSSSALIEASPPNLAVESLMVTMDQYGVSFSQLYGALDAFKGVKVHVVGDAIVDTITQTTLIGGNTKTPTPSVQIQGHTDYVGGAAIVAKHMRSAGADVIFSTVLGNDAAGELVIRELTDAGIDVRAEIDTTRPTTNKNAIVASGYRLLKIDAVDNRSISTRVLGRITNDLFKSEADIVVFADFRHGIFNRDTIPQLICAIPPDAFKVADSQVASRWGNILEFQGFDLITPNEREARFALGDQDSVIRPLASRLYNEANCKSLILKLGERGVLAHRSKIGEQHDFYVVSSFVDQVVDAVGAGDAMLAYATLAKKTTGSDLIAAILGSLAAAIECEVDGNIPVTPDDVKRKINEIERRAVLQMPQAAE